MRAEKDKKNMKQKGFTLIEVMVAALILVAAALPIMSSFMYAQKMNVKGRQKEQAMIVAQNTVETIKALGAYVAYGYAEEGKSGVLSAADIWSAVSKTEIEKAKTIDGVTVTYDDLQYEIKISPIIMGQTEYSVKVTVKLDDTNDVNVKQYAYKDDFQRLELAVMRYYKIKAEVSLAGQTDVLAEYNGTVVTRN